MRPSFVVGAASLLVGGWMTIVVAQQTQTPLMPSASKTVPPRPAMPLNRQGSTAHPPSPAAAALNAALFGKEYRLAREAEQLAKAGDLRSAEKACLAALAAAPPVQQHPDPDVEQLLGRIYLREGRYQEAIPHLQACDPYIRQDIQGLDLTVAYARLGDYAHARNYYNDRIVRNTRMTKEPLTAADLPGVSDLRSLEASALLMSGLDDFFHADKDNALAHLLAAEHLKPNNAVTAYFVGQILLDRGRSAEAITRFEKVVASPHSSIFLELQEKLQRARALAAVRH